MHVRGGIRLCYPRGWDEREDGKENLYLQEHACMLHALDMLCHGLHEVYLLPRRCAVQLNGCDTVGLKIFVHCMTASLNG